MEEHLKRIIAYLNEQESGVLFIQRLAAKENAAMPWMVSFEFGREAEDSDMVGGAAYGLGKTAEEAIGQVAGQCGLDHPTEEHVGDDPS